MKHSYKQSKKAIIKHSMLHYVIQKRFHIYYINILLNYKDIIHVSCFFIIKISYL